MPVLKKYYKLTQPSLRREEKWGCSNNRLRVVWNSKRDDQKFTRSTLTSVRAESVPPDLERCRKYFNIVWKRHDERHLWISAIPKKKNLSTFGRIILAACWRKRMVLSHFLDGKHLWARHCREIDNFCFIVVYGTKLVSSVRASCTAVLGSNLLTAGMSKPIFLWEPADLKIFGVDALGETNNSINKDTRAVVVAQLAEWSLLTPVIYSFESQHWKKMNCQLYNM